MRGGGAGAHGSRTAGRQGRRARRQRASPRQAAARGAASRAPPPPHTHRQQEARATVQQLSGTHRAGGQDVGRRPARGRQPRAELRGQQRPGRRARVARERVPPQDEGRPEEGVHDARHDEAQRAVEQELGRALAPVGARDVQPRQEEEQRHEVGLVAVDKQLAEQEERRVAALGRPRVRACARMEEGTQQRRRGGGRQ
jgi:hypothetical protein